MSRPAAGGGDPQGLDVAAAVTAAGQAKALGDPTRLTIARALRDGEELCV